MRLLDYRKDINIVRSKLYEERIRMKPLMSALILVLVNLTGCMGADKMMAPSAPEHDDRHGISITQEDKEDIETKSKPKIKIPVM